MSGEQSPDLSGFLEQLPSEPTQCDGRRVKPGGAGGHDDVDGAEVAAVARNIAATITLINPISFKLIQSEFLYEYTLSSAFFSQ